MRQFTQLANTLKVLMAIFWIAALVLSAPACLQQASSSWETANTQTRAYPTRTAGPKPSQTKEPSPTSTESPITATRTLAPTQTQTPTRTASLTQTTTATAANLAEIVQHLDTPDKLSAFLLQEITFADHGGCISYWPDVFYQKREGNCKDYSTFSSYILAQNGYPSRRIVYTFYRDGIRLDHEVAAYTIGDETWIMSNGYIYGPFASLNEYFKSLAHLDYVTLLCIKPPGGVTCCNP